MGMVPRIGLTLPNQGVRFGVTTAQELVDLAVEADRSRAFRSVWVGDSLLAKPRLEVGRPALGDREPYRARATGHGVHGQLPRSRPDPARPAVGEPGPPQRGTHGPHRLHRDQPPGSRRGRDLRRRSPRTREPYGPVDHRDPPAVVRGRRSTSMATASASPGYRWSRSPSGSRRSGSPTTPRGVGIAWSASIPASHAMPMAGRSGCPIPQRSRGGRQTSGRRRVRWGETRTRSRSRPITTSISRTIGMPPWTNRSGSWIPTIRRTSTPSTSRHGPRQGRLASASSTCARTSRSA